MTSIKTIACFTLLTLAALAARPDRAAAALPSDLTFDDGYTFFELENHTGSARGKLFSTGWTLESQLRIWGVVSDRSAFKVVIKQNGKVLGTTRQEAKVERAEPGATGLLGVMWRPNWHDDDHLKNPILAEGDIDVEVYYIDGGDDTEHLARTYRLHVRKVERENNSTAYYISRHGEAVSSLLNLNAMDKGIYFDSVGVGSGSNQVQIVYNISGGEQRPSSEGFLRCTVDGKPIQLVEPNMKRGDQVISQAPERFYTVIHTDRNMRQYHRGAAFRNPISFRQYVAALPLTFGKPGEPGRANHRVSISDHPGRWECTYIENGKVIRIWRFTVGAQGNVEAHPEESQGLSLAPFAHLVETEVPEGGSFIDGRLHPEAVRTGAFYGRPWKTPEGQAMAANVPAKGNPWPVPSGPKEDRVDPNAEARKKLEETRAAHQARDAARLADVEARRKEAARAAKESRAQDDAEDAARDAEVQKQLAAAEAETRATADAEAAEAMREARAAIVDAEDKMEDMNGVAAVPPSGTSTYWRLMWLLHWFGRFAVAAALAASGLLLAEGFFVSKIPAVTGLVQSLRGRARLIGLAAIGVALGDVVLDLLILRPLVGDGVPQLLTVFAGILVLGMANTTTADNEAAPAFGSNAKANAAVERLETVLQGQRGRLAGLEAHRASIGIACAIAGLVHLLLGGGLFV